MDTPLTQKNIKISGVEDVQWGLKIKDEQGAIYNVPKTKKGTQIETVAFQALKNLQGYGMGMDKCFKFALVPNQAGGESRYVRMITEPELEQFQGNSPLPSPEPQYVPNNALTPLENVPVAQNKPLNSSDKPNWEEINFGKCKHQFLIEILKMSKGDQLQNSDYQQDAERACEQWATMSMRRMPTPQQPTETPMDNNIDNIQF